MLNFVIMCRIRYLPSFSAIELSKIDTYPVPPSALINRRYLAHLFMEMPPHVPTLYRSLVRKRVIILRRSDIWNKTIYL